MNEIEINHAWKEMLHHLFDVVNGVQDGREIREKAFEDAERWARELTKLLKGSEMLPRAFLHKLDMAAGILENEASHSPDERRVLAMSRAVRYTLGLILWGQCHDDYKPGVPRAR
jgi:hypothetical protein